MDTNKQNIIVNQWTEFSKTEAYKEWIQNMQIVIEENQKVCDDLIDKNGNIITLAHAGALNQRNAGIKKALLWGELRIKG